MKNLSLAKKMIINNTSPIKVRKTNFGLSKIKSVSHLKTLRLSFPLHKRVIKKKNIIINTDKIIKKNLYKYNSTPFYFYKKLTNQIIFNLPCKLVSVFKDYLIWNETFDYIMNIYSLNKSNNLLPKLGIYYETYTLFIPIYFPLMDVRNILKKYFKNKIKILEMTIYEDDLRDELNDIERNIIDCETNNANRINNENTIENNEELISYEINKKNNEQKLINSSEIKTENSNSVSNYFGIESTIKSKGTSINSIYPENEKIDNFSSILERIKNKNDINKMNFDYSVELASIIQLFEEKNKTKNKIINNNKKINSINKKNSKDLEMNRKLLRTGDKSKTYKYIFNSQSKESSKKSKISINSSRRKRIINFNKNIKISDNINNSSKKALICHTYRNRSIKKLKLFPVTNKNEENSDRINYHTKINKGKDNSQMIRNNIYKSFLSTKNIKKNNIYSLTQSKTRPLFKRQTINKLIRIIKKKQKNYEDSKFLKSYKKFKSKSKNKEKDDLSINKTCEYSLVYASPSNNFKNPLKNSKTVKKIRNNNKSLIEAKSLYKNKNYSNTDIKKFIFVRKKESNNYIFGNKKNRKFINTIDSSFNTVNSSNKITVNKMENLRKSIKNENNLNTPKSKKIINFIDSNTIESKNSLNHNNILEKDVYAFIPKTVMKKMFLNKIFKGKLLCKPLNNLSMKKHEVYSKYFMTYSSNNGSNSKANILLKTNNKNKFVSKINIKNKKNLKIMTKFNKFMTTAPKKIKSAFKKDNQSDFRSSSKFSIFSLNESNPSYKNRNALFKDNIKNKNKIISYTDRNLEANHKNNLMINSNISNDIKFNSQTEDDRISIKSCRVQYLNNNLKLPNTSSFLNKKSNKNEIKKINKNKMTNLIKNFTFDNKFFSKNNKKISKQKNIINNNYYYTIDFSNRIPKKKS